MNALRVVCSSEVESSMYSRKFWVKEGSIKFEILFILKLTVQLKVSLVELIQIIYFTSNNFASEAEFVELRYTKRT